jgi:hypothetical protein
VRSTLIALLYAVLLRVLTSVVCFFLLLLLLLLLLLRYSLMKVFTWFLEPTDYCIIQNPCGKFVFVMLKVIRSPRSGIRRYLTFSEVVAVDV